MAEMSQTVTATGIESVVKVDEMNVCEGVLCKTSAAKFTKLSSGPAGGRIFLLWSLFLSFFSGSKALRGDQIAWERDRIAWIRHAKDAAQTFELCIYFKL